MMRDLTDRRKHQRPSRIAHALAPIRFLAEEEKRLIKRTYRIDYGLSDQKIAARYHLHLVFHVPFPVRHLVAPQKSWPRQPRQPGSQQDLIERGRVHRAGLLHRAIRVENPASHCGHCRMRIEPLDRPLQNISMNDGIRIQQENMPSTGNFKALIVGGGETHVPRVPDQPHLWKDVCYHIGRPIIRRIVDHDHVKDQSIGARENRIKTRLQHFARVPVDDNDGEVWQRHGFVFNFAWSVGKARPRIETRGLHKMPIGTGEHI